MSNRLASATSPYLLQHKDNPVAWWPWTEAAFAEARGRDVPVFLSVGYSACHWCHVMAHESFEDSETAAILNDGFVSVKVDREERPDVDAVYMAAVQGLTGQGGWPMTVFLTPNGEPFYAGTYFPPEPRGGMPSFRQVLNAVTEAWRQRRADINKTAADITAALQARPIAGIDQHEVDPHDVAQALGQAERHLAREFDSVNSGFGSAPKFPPTPVLEFLLRHYARTGSASALEMATRTCEAMARGGIYDQLAGGFCRYSVDATWTVPHFEKMLYDNAGLLRVYAQLAHLTGDDTIIRVVHQTTDFLLRDLSTGSGFASALDADSPAEVGGAPVEGAVYVWTPEQVVSACGADGKAACDIFGVTASGTFESGTSVLQLRGNQGAAATDWALIDQLRERMLQARGQRPQPQRDDKVVAAWNGLAISGLVQVWQATGRADALAAAISCADFLLAVHTFDGGRRLWRVSKDGVANTFAPGVLEDYANVAEGFLALYQATADPRWLTACGSLLDTVIDDFADADQGFFDTAGTRPVVADGAAVDHAPELIVRPQDPADIASPSGWSAATGALLSFGTLMASERHLRWAHRGLSIASHSARRSPRFAGWLLAVAEAFVDGPYEVIIVGSDPADRVRLRQAAIQANRPGSLVVDGPQQVDVPGPFAARPAPVSGAVAYVCWGSTCYPPVTTAPELEELLTP